MDPPADPRLLRVRRLVRGLQRRSVVSFVWEWQMKRFAVNLTANGSARWPWSGPKGECGDRGVEGRDGILPLPLNERRSPDPCPGLSARPVSEGVPALDDPDQDHHDREDQENVDEAPEGIRAHHPQQPQDEQDHEDCPEHRSAPSIAVGAHSEGGARRALESRRGKRDARIPDKKRGPRWPLFCPASAGSACIFYNMLIMSSF